MRLEQVTSGIRERPRTTSAANSKRKTANQISKFQMITEPNMRGFGLHPELSCVR